MKADLHVHSTFSDGSLTPGECVLAARAVGLDYLSITDHDTTSHVRSAVGAGLRWGITLLAGVEISAWDSARKRKAHILGYGFRLPAPSIEELCEPLRKARHNRTIESIEILRGLGYDIDVERVASLAHGPLVLYKQHVMAWLLESGQVKDLLGDDYRRLFKGTGPCAGDIGYVDCRDAIRAIHEDGGLAVLAHPGQTDSIELAAELAREGLDGLETNHADNDEAARRNLEALCAEKGLFATGGSDFHGFYGMEGPIGSESAPDGGRGLLAALGLRDPSMTS